MAGLMVGSALLTWILCSAFNAGMEALAVAGHLDRSNAFVAMVCGMIAILAGMNLFCIWIYPESAQAGMLFLSEEQARVTARLAACADSLLVIGYAGFQLRRFWDED